VLTAYGRPIYCISGAQRKNAGENGETWEKTGENGNKEKGRCAD
jgi:hypothetical protein